MLDEKQSILVLLENEVKRTIHETNENDAIIQEKWLDAGDLIIRP